MSSVSVDQQLHGYKGGHHLLAASIRLSRDDQDLIDRLSDLSGPLDPGQTFDAYLTTYPLPSGEYYVVARTWQDRHAQRAGCVLTRSLIFSIADWRENPAMVPALTVLRPFEKEGATAERLDLHSSEETIEPVSGSWVDEITEALFLEERQPIVVFGARDADAVLSRLLISLWPGLRRQFSTCGFALGPRRLAERPFDLLFAPATSRVRFADWVGRKVEAGSAHPPRHRWTSATSDQIFRASDPNLGTFDSLGVLRTDKEGSEGAFRVALLWNELVKKVDSSPNAALGLLDILRSQHTSISFALVAPALKKSVLISEQQNDAFEHLRLLLTMVGKFEELAIPLSLLRLIYESARKTAAANPMDAFAFLSSADSLGRVIPRILCGPLAAAAAGRLDQIFSQFVLLLPQTRLRLLASDSVFASELVAASWPNGPELVENIKSALEYSDDKMRERAAGHLLPALSRPEQAPIVAACFWGADWPTVERDIALLWRGCRLSIPAFDPPILEAATALNVITSLRFTVARLPESADTDRLLLSTFRGCLDDISWLVAEKGLSPGRRAGLLLRLVSNTGDDELRRTGRSPELKQKLLELLRPLKVGPDQLARVFAVSGVAGTNEFNEALSLLPEVSASGLQRRLALALLRALLFAEFGKTWSVVKTSEILAACSPYLSAADVIIGVTDTQLEAADINRNIQALNATTDALRVRILREIDNLSERIIAFRHIPRQHSYFDRNTTEAWARLISDAGHVNARAQKRAADLVLPFALKMKYGPATPLIITTFPVVHAELAKGYVAPNILTVFVFGDWDRCDTLRRELVDAFGSSEWPPADLMVTAFAANESVAVSKLVFRRLDKKYRNAIVKDAGRLKPDVQEAIRQLFAGESGERPLRHN